jgi:hypothetical protein
MLAFYQKPLFAAFLLVFSLALLPGDSAQSGGSSTSLTGTVVDPTGAVVANATVEIHNPVSGFSRTAVTDNAGKFSIPNIPFNPYHLDVAGPGFAAYSQDVDVRSVVPVNLNIALQVTVDLSGLTGDQQLQAGLFCGNARPTLSKPLGVCTSGYGSTLIGLPAQGKENDDSNPPRVASRNLFDLALGDDNLFHGERYKWSLTLTAINVTDKRALYNFLSTFSGTHYVTPRALTAELGFHF